MVTARHPYLFTNDDEIGPVHERNLLLSLLGFGVIMLHFALIEIEVSYYLSIMSCRTLATKSTMFSPFLRQIPSIIRCTSHQTSNFINKQSHKYSINLNLIFIFIILFIKIKYKIKVNVRDAVSWRKTQRIHKQR